MKNNSIRIGFFWIALVVISACSSSSNDPEKAILKTRMDTISYIIGLDYGAGIREEQIDVNKLAVFKGLSDGLVGNTEIPDSIKERIIDGFNEELRLKLEKQGKQLLEKNKLEGLKFLEENIDNEGVVLLPSGLQYKILKESEGPRPAEQDSVLVHYRAMFINRDVFDMSYDRGPAGLRINTLISGLSEGMQLIPTGGIYELYIPPELAYGDVTFANVIPAGSTLIYTIELIEIIKE